MLYSRPLSVARPRSRSTTVPASRDRSGNRRTGRPVGTGALRRTIADIERGIQGIHQQLGVFRSTLRPAAQGSGQAQHQGIHHSARHQVPNDADLLYLQHADFNFALPGRLDFETQGFRMGDEAQARPQPPLPTYEPPPAARPGYTRSPNEEDVMICPNCNDELGVGHNAEKRQVWIVRKCGHVSDPDSLVLICH